MNVDMYIPSQRTEEELNREIYERNLNLHIKAFNTWSDELKLETEYPAFEFLKFIFIQDDNDIFEKLSTNTQTHDGNFQMTEMNRLCLIYFKSKNEDLTRIKKQLGFENNIISDEIKLFDVTNDDLLREVRIVTKEKIELINEKNKIEDELAKYKVK
jgi:hypothetical protein